MLTALNIPGSFPLCPPLFSTAGIDSKGKISGLQIREDRFDSGTRLQHLADFAQALSTRFSTFRFWFRSVPRT